MNQDDRKAIEGLFGKLAAVERQATPRDTESEAYIQEQIARQPGSPYYMAQTIVVQEQALAAANARIAELEHGPAQREEPRRGGLFGGLFGGNERSQPRAASPWGNAQPNAQTAPVPTARGGGFLAGAAQTAVGVAGGVMLGNALGGLFGADEAQAAEPNPPEEAGDDGDDGGLFGGFDGFGGDE